MTQSNFSRKISHLSSSSNETWPILTMCMSSSEPQKKVVVPTAKRTKTDILSIDTIETNDDLQALKKKDPFMYYSIPAIRDATMLLQDVDASSLESSTRRHCISCPARMQHQDLASSTKKIKRKTCLSMECHSDLLMAKLIGDESLREEEKEAYDELDELFRLLD